MGMGKNVWRRWSAMIGAVPLALGGVVVIQVVAAAPASAVPGLTRVTVLSATDSVAQKTATALCPVGTRIVGGGGRVQEFSMQTRRVALNRLQPVPTLAGSQDGYVVSGAETAPGTTGTWRVQATALCATQPAGYEINSVETAPSSASVQQTTSGCGSGRVVIGGGARINNLNGQIVLQVARPSGPGDIYRGQGHEDADGVGTNWTVTAYSICANPLPGYEVIFGESPEAGSESVKTAFAECSPGKVLVSTGAAISFTASGSVGLLGAVPFGEGTQGIAAENTPTSENWDFIVATAICAT